MTPLSDKQELQREVAQTQYSLRAFFFYRARKSFQLLCDTATKIDSSKYDWRKRRELGISKSSWDYIRKKRIPYCQVFCHPRVIRESPALIGYYRSIALLPQKGLQRLAFGTKSLEEGKRKSLSEDKAVQLTRTINSLISSIIDSDPSFSIKDIWLAAQANLGTQINGSWRNAIGIEGSHRISSLVLKHFLDNQQVLEIVLKDGSIVPSSKLPATVEEVRGFTLINGYKILFGSEPDISVRNRDGILEGAIEVKAGEDPAGAMERYGAAKKSFDKALNENKAAITLYLASCLTSTVKDAIANDRLVKKDFNLTKIFLDDKAREEFLKDLTWIVHL